MLAFWHSPTLEEIDEVMATYRYDSPDREALPDDSIAWDFFTIERYGDLATLRDLIARGEVNPIESLAVLASVNTDVHGWPIRTVLYKTCCGNPLPHVRDASHYVLLDVHE
jgi:hypothetical protein